MWPSSVVQININVKLAKQDLASLALWERAGERVTVMARLSFIILGRRSAMDVGVACILGREKLQTYHLVMNLKLM